MAVSHTPISWTDATWNPVRGCVKVSAGCKNCYAETFAERFRGVPGHPYEQGFDLRLVPEQLEVPLHWRTPRRIFVNSMSDLFQDGVPDAFIDQVFAVMALCPQHTFQVLTKRAERMRAYLLHLTGRLGELWDLTNQPTWITLPAGRSFPRYPENWPLSNVWIGVSVENQHFADERIPLLLQTPAAVRFISAEPLLGAIDLDQFIWPGCIATKEQHDAHHDGGMWCDERSLDWVIVGGESGPGSRPFDVAWARSIVGQCKAAGVPCFVKQFGAHVIDRNDAGFEGDTPTSWPMDTHTSGSEPFQGEPLRVHLKKKGGDPSEWPKDLRVRQFPEVR